MVEVQLVAKVAPPLVIDVLLPPAIVLAHRHDVPVLIRTDPDIAPRRWDHEVFDPRLGGVGHRPAVRVAIAEPASVLTPADTGFITGYVDESGDACAFLGVLVQVRYQSSEIRGRHGSDLPGSGGQLTSTQVVTGEDDQDDIESDDPDDRVER